MKWLEDGAPDNDVVVSTRIRLARNLADVPFPSRIVNPDDVEKVHGLAKQSLLVSPEFSYSRLSDMTELEKRALVEQHVISADLSRSRFGGLITSTDESISVMILEEDHYRLQSLSAGLALFKAFDAADRLDNMLSEGVDYAFDDKLGFLTSCPTNLGTGLRASLMLHLPALTAAKALPRITSMISKVGMTVRGAFGEGSAASGAFYQISNQVTLGVSEKEILSRLLLMANKVINFERSTRKELYNSLGIALEDRIWRAVGILKYAKRLGDAEAQKLVSDVAFGVSLGIVPDLKSSQLYKLMMNTRPAIIAQRYGQVNPADRDVSRAEMIKQVFAS